MSHHNNNNQPQHQQYQQDDFVDVDDYNSATGYPLQQRMTPQQQRQEERRRHAENATTNGAAAAAAGQGASPWLNKQKKKSGKWKTIAWSVLVILILAVAGVLAWYFAVYKKNNSNGGSNNSNGSTGGGGNIATGDTGKQLLSSLRSPSITPFWPIASTIDATTPVLFRECRDAIYTPSTTPSPSFIYVINQPRERQPTNLVNHPACIE
ncbi:MAG: hypothetical protein J3R72DRAFT_179421 [Linnemannia gamsii]|nr:MAG: hypothetical protein J3R72DRAFT_179421 [Linnemannia gamsii]